MKKVEHILLYLLHKKIHKGDEMKIMDKVELIVKLKEKIEEAKKENLKSAKRLQNLLESIIKSGEVKAI